MSLLLIKVLELIFAIGGVTGLCVHSVPPWLTWLCFFFFLCLDTWRSLRVGVIAVAGLTKYYLGDVDRDDSPVLFACFIMFQGLLALVCLFGFLFSLR